MCGNPSVGFCKYFSLISWMSATAHVLYVFRNHKPKAVPTEGLFWIKSNRRQSERREEKWVLVVSWSSGILYFSTSFHHVYNFSKRTARIIICGWRCSPGVTPNLKSSDVDVNAMENWEHDQGTSRLQKLTIFTAQLNFESNVFPTDVVGIWRSRKPSMRQNTNDCSGHLTGLGLFQNHVGSSSQILR